jgi:hypothetical protein
VIICLLRLLWGSYEQPVSKKHAAVAVKIIDMLGEEVLEVEKVK